MGDRSLDRWLERYRDQRDVGALGRLFDAASGELLRVARHLTGDAAEAEDLVQATFLALLEHPERYDGRGSAMGWMVGILTREAQAVGRRAARRPDPERALEPARAREEAERPARLADDAEGLGAVRAALRRVPELYRGVLERHLLAGQEPAAIAAEVGRSAATVRVQLHRGLAQLRQLLPAGLASGLVIAVGGRGSARGLGAVRADVLAQAAALPGGTGPVATGAGALLGALFIAKKALLFALLASLVTTVWLLRAGDGAADPGPSQGDGVLLAVEPMSSVSAGVDVSSVSSGVDVGSDLAEPSARSVVESPAAAPVGGPALRPRLRVRTVFANGEPAGGVTFHYGVSRPGAEPQPARTDAEGYALLEGLAPGPYVLLGDRGGHGLAQLPDVRVNDAEVERSAEQLAELIELLTFDAVLELDPGHDVTGRVVDGEGRAVAGAAIWITTGLTRDSGIEAARSGADGSFALRQLGSACFVGARSDQHAPSRPVHVEHLLERARAGGAEGAAALTCELLLPGAGARVTGTVVDPAGRPVAGARVRLGAQDQFDSYGPTGVEGPPPPLEVCTDERGAFEGGGLAPGRVEVACLADGFPVQTAVVEVAVGGAGRADLRLAPAAWIRGRLVDTAGAPVQGVTVRTWQRRLHGLEARSSFDEPSAWSPADGGFLLGPLVAGEVTIYGRTSDGAQEARSVLQVVAGETYEWTLALGESPTLRGVALGEDGAPLVGWTVSAHPMAPQGPPPRAVVTGADGSFVLRFSKAGLVRLALLLPEEPARTWATPRAPQSWLDDVPVPGAGVRLMLDPLQRPSARLVGELVAPAGLEPALTVAHVQHAEFGEVARVELIPGHGPFELGGLPAGLVELSFEAKDCAPLRLGELELTQGAVLDLGALALTRR